MCGELDLLHNRVVSSRTDSHITVYVPHSYAISGITYIVPKEQVHSFLQIFIRQMP
jgi:hypothetical protein